MAGKIFINYRRDDSIGMAGRLHDRLAQTFGHGNLFIDVDNIPVGVDFVAHLNSQVAGCNVLLVVIGPNWLNAKDESGRRRLDDPDDFVAIEIAAALTRDIRVIPVLVDGARMPKASELPDSLKPLARRQAAEVRHAHFGQDADAGRKDGPGSGWWLGWVAPVAKDGGRRRGGSGSDASGRLGWILLDVGAATCFRCPPRCGHDSHGGCEAPGGRGRTGNGLQHLRLSNSARQKSQQTQKQKQSAMRSSGLLLSGRRRSAGPKRGPKPIRRP